MLSLPKPSHSHTELIIPDMECSVCNTHKTFGLSFIGAFGLDYWYNAQGFFSKPTSSSLKDPEEHVKVDTPPKCDALTENIN